MCAKIKPSEILSIRNMYILLMQRFRVVYHGISLGSLVFSGIHIKARVYTKKTQVMSGIFHAYTTRKGCITSCITILYHAIGKVGCDTVELH